MSRHASGPAIEEATVRFLLDPASYPEPTRSVEPIETHMSWVFLTDRFAYKLKKPVRFSFLDFSTVALRKHFCEEELRLNRRLAPLVYITTVPILRQPRGSMTVGGAGAIVDWLVKMHRLPAHRMLDRAIAERSFSDEEIERLGLRLARFYRTAPPFAYAPSEYLHRISTDVAADLHELHNWLEYLPHRQLQRVENFLLSFIQTYGKLLEQRANDGRIVEAHGDLRPEHIFLGNDPQIIDCLEFNPRFRMLDPADELAYFAMECEMLGNTTIGSRTIACYLRETGDTISKITIVFYKCARACLRAKLALWHLSEPLVPDAPHWILRARSYIDRAVGYAPCG